MKIGIPLLSLGSYGGVRKIVEISNYLAEKNEVWILYPKGRGETPFKISPKVKLVESPFKNRFLHLIYCINLLNLEGFDVLIFNFFPTSYLWFFVNKRAVYFVQDVEYRFYDNPILKALAFLTYTFPINKITYNPAICESLNCEMLINPGVDKEVFRPLKLKRERFKIMYIPRKEKRKGFDVFLKAIRILKERGVNFSVLFVGGTSSYDLEIQNLGIPFEHIYPKDDLELAKAYNSVGVFVLTSKVEGLGFPVLEALACGTPVVATVSDGARVWGKWVSLAKDESELADKIWEVFEKFDEHLERVIRFRDEIPSTFDMVRAFEDCLSDIK